MSTTATRRAKRKPTAGRQPAAPAKPATAKKPQSAAALLDRGAGAFRLAPFGINVPSGRAYEPGTNTLAAVEAAAGIVLADQRKEINA